MSSVPQIAAMPPQRPRRLPPLAHSMPPVRRSHVRRVDSQGSAPRIAFRSTGRQSSVEDLVAAVPPCEQTEDTPSAKEQVDENGIGNEIAIAMFAVEANVPTRSPVPPSGPPPTFRRPGCVKSGMMQRRLHLLGASTEFQGVQGAWDDQVVTTENR